MIETLKDASQKIAQRVREIEDQLLLKALMRDDDFITFLKENYKVEYRGGEVFIRKILPDPEGNRLLLHYRELIEINGLDMQIGFSEVSR